MDSVSVNGVAIPEAAILAEAQNHPAADAAAALAEAREALVVRELLHQEAMRRGLAPQPRTGDPRRREADDETAIRSLIEDEISVPEADEATCRRYYDNNRSRFRSPDLYEAAHILYAAQPDDRAAYAAAELRARAALARLSADPGAFAALAQAESACPSGRDGGRLGQVARGDTVPEVETFLAALSEGQLCPVPVKSRYGVHVLRLDRKLPGRDLPFEAVHRRIAERLQEASWRRAVAQYVRVLAGRARIDGIAIDSASSPLVQ
ncbi:MAG: peptidylprolyl isomerase [Alphaproteobacteria bacterium]